jgi:hypothetical protein
LRAVFAFLRVFLDLNKPVIFLEQIMEKIGDKESAIAERVRALLAAANNTAAAVAAAPAASPAIPAAAVPSPPGRRRLDPSLDPATVVANLTAAGIQLAVRICSLKLAVLN